MKRIQAPSSSWEGGRERLFKSMKWASVAACSDLASALKNWFLGDSFSFHSGRMSITYPEHHHLGNSQDTHGQLKMALVVCSCDCLP
jgi:hypothetical protein